MNQVERVASLFTTASGQETFMKWLSDEVTQLMLSAARELCQPGIPAACDAGSIGIALGKTIGANSIVDYLSRPFRAPQDMGVASLYGADEIIKEDGYGQ